MTQFTIGCDPEIFVTQKGKAVSAYGMIPGTKDKPHPTSHGAVQVDGMALELNTTPAPVNNFEVFNNNLVRQMKNLQNMVKAAGNYNLAIKPVQDFTQEDMDNAPAEAKELGCDPDFCAYTMEPNPRPEGTVNFRTGAGHIHIGWGENIPVDNMDHMQICADFVKVLDMTVGLFMTVIDTDPRRRVLYGKAGAFRPKPYGVEYRTPSNVWIKNLEFRKCVHSLVNRAIQLHSTGYTYLPNMRSIEFEDIRKVIDEGNTEKAKEWLNYAAGFSGPTVAYLAKIRAKKNIW